MVTKEQETILSCLSKAMSALCSLGLAKETKVLQCESFDKLEKYIDQIRKGLG